MLMTRYFLEILKEQKVRCQKPDRNFRNDAYQVAGEALNTRFKMDLSNDNIINHLKTFKRKNSYRT